MQALDVENQRLRTALQRSQLEVRRLRASLHARSDPCATMSNLPDDIVVLMLQRLALRDIRVSAGVSLSHLALAAKAWRNVYEQRGGFPFAHFCGDGDYETMRLPPFLEQPLTSAAVLGSVIVAAHATTMEWQLPYRYGAGPLISAGPYEGLISVSSAAEPSANDHLMYEITSKHRRCTSVALKKLPTGETLLAAGFCDDMADGSIQVWDLAVHKAHPLAPPLYEVPANGGVDALFWAGPERILFCAVTHNVALLHNLPNNTTSEHVDHTPYLNLAPQGSTQLKPLNPHQPTVTVNEGLMAQAVAIAGDEEGASEVYTVRLWRLAAEPLPQILPLLGNNLVPVQEAMITAVTLDADAPRMVVADENGILKVYNVDAEGATVTCTTAVHTSASVWLLHVSGHALLGASWYEQSPPTPAYEEGDMPPPPGPVEAMHASLSVWDLRVAESKPVGDLPIRQDATVIALGYDEGRVVSIQPACAVSWRPKSTAWLDGSLLTAVAAE